MIAIKYVGRRPRYREGAYGSGIEFTRGETVLVPDDLGVKLLRHPDVYARGADSEAASMHVAAEPDGMRDEEDSLQEIRDSIAMMDKAALEMFAKTHFSVTLNRRQRVDSLRQQVAGLVEQFGVA